MIRVIADRYAEIPGCRRVGGQSEVIQASDLHNAGSTVAVKMIRADDDPIHKIFSQRETAALDKLDHHNIYGRTSRPLVGLLLAR